MAVKTLADKVTRNFSKVKINKTFVKVPKLKIKKIAKLEKEDKIPTSSIIKILIKTAVEKARVEKKDKDGVKKDRVYILLKEGKPLAAGGYGTTSKNYGSTPHASYADYEKLFSYLGKFRAQSPYENLSNSQTGRMNKLLDDKFSMVDKETMETGARYVKYLKPQAAELDTTSLVPIAGMSSADWEQFKLWAKLEPVMYRLKISTS